VTGVEALYLDMGHFGRKPVRLAWLFVALPALLANYFGQGALVLSNPQAIENPFYLMAPEWALWPMVVLAALATVIASQAVISGAFSLANQGILLGLLPRMEILHTSETERGQIYMPMVNWALLALVIFTVIQFKESGNLAAAYGISVTTTMLITTTMLAVVMYNDWKIKPVFVFLLVGLFFIDQNVKIDGTEESGNAQWRFSQSTTNTALWKTPGLFEGYGIKTNAKIHSTSAAIFGQLDWAITDRLQVLPGLRYNYDKKAADYNRKTYGGLQTTNAALIALQRLVYTDQAFTSSTDNTDFSGNLTVTYKASDKINAYATYAKSYKPVGVNVAGLPTIGGQPALDLAVIKPENVNHYELGIKTSPIKNSILNFTLFTTEIKDYQTNVQAAELGVNRGYLANADKVRVKGAELDASFLLNKHFSFNAAATYTDGKYVKFTNAPLPLEETGAAISFKDVSGTDLPGMSKWAGSIGGEYTENAKFFGNVGKFFIAFDGYARSEFSSSPSASKYLVVPGYAIFNGRLGFRVADGLSAYVWGRNLLNKDYYEQLLPAGGNSGHYAGVLGDQRTYGLTLRYAL
jgi:hypothetical protein